MKKPSSIAWLGIIFCITLVIEITTWAMGGLSGKAVARVIFLIALFAMLLKGLNFARHILSTLYVLGGIFSLVYAIQMGAQPLYAVVFGGVGIFFIASAGFFMRSRVLRALTSRSANSPS